jgi:hypothetical protein
MSGSLITAAKKPFVQLGPSIFSPAASLGRRTVHQSTFLENRPLRDASWPRPLFVLAAMAFLFWRWFLPTADLHDSNLVVR